MRKMMRPIRLFVAFMIVLTSACTLTSAPPTTPDATEFVSTAVDLPRAVIPPTSTASPAPTATIQPAANNTTLIQSVRQPPCTARTDWPQYTVVAGDTLAGIARRTGSSVSALTTANCLTDANLISVGQKLRVPVQPSAPPPPSNPIPVAVGSVSAYPAIFANNTYTLPRSMTITLSWFDAPRSGADTVEFISYPASPSARAQGMFTVIGTDTNLGDGAAVVYSVPSDGVGYLGAVAKRNGVVVSRTTTEVAYAIGSLQSQPCTATVSFPAANLYGGPGSSYAIVSTIAGADSFPVSGRNGNWYNLVYPGQSQTWIDAAVVTLSGDCTTVPTIPGNNPQPCTATVNIPATNLYSGPGINYVIVSTIAGADRFPVNGRTDVGAIWYNLTYPGQSQAWIDSAVVTLSGDCGAIPVISSTRPPVSPTSAYVVVVSPTLGQSDGWTKLQAGGTVELNLTYDTDNPPTRVEYYLAPTGTGITPSLIGSSEGSASWPLNWTVQAGMLGYVHAKVYTASGNVYETTAIQIMAE
jgi:LysM repeat protein